MNYVPIIIHIWMSFSNVLHLAEAAFHQKEKLEYTAKCNSFIVFG